ncbi:hypothetical protein DFS33DRAFT_1387170 [Desarmillaria ectypa]|nr:hypothetical protein DFS33DRAFT_1387170 [Desarmillaria ectypa]
MPPPPQQKAAIKKEKNAATKAKRLAPKKAPAKRSRASDVEFDASSEELETETSTKRVKTDKKTTTAQAMPTFVAEKKPDFAGKLDLYNMPLDYLRRFAREMKSEFSAQVAIPKAPYFDKDGAEKDPAFCIEDMDIPPFPMRLKYIRAVDTIGYIGEELNFFPKSDDDAVRSNAPGLMADLKLAGRNPSASRCLRKFLMHRCWVQTKG